MYVSTHVDDCAVVFTSQVLRDRVFDALKEYVKLRNEGPMVRHLGIQIVDDGQGLMLLHQKDYEEILLAKFEQYGVKEARIPMAKGQVVPRFEQGMEEEAERAKGLPVLKLLGSLWWLAQNCRPDIILPVHMVAGAVSVPLPVHFDILLVVLGYIKATMSYGLVYVDPKRPDYHSFYAGGRMAEGLPDIWHRGLTSFTDSDWATCTLTRRSRGC